MEETQYDRQDKVLFYSETLFQLEIGNRLKFVVTYTPDPTQMDKTV